MSTLDDARTFALDLGERALNSAWQGALASAAPVILAANTPNTLHLAWWQQLAGIAGTGAITGVLSLVKGVIAGSKTGTASLSTQVAQTAVAPGAHAIDNQADPAGFMGIGKAAPVDPPVELPQPSDAIYVADGTNQTGSTT